MSIFAFAFRQTERGRVAKSRECKKTKFGNKQIQKSQNLKMTTIFLCIGDFLTTEAVSIFYKFPGFPKQALKGIIFCNI